MSHICSPFVRKVTGRGEMRVSAGLWEAEGRLVCGLESRYGRHQRHLDGHREHRGGQGRRLAGTWGGKGFPVPPPPLKPLHNQGEATLTQNLKTSTYMQSEGRPWRPCSFSTKHGGYPGVWCDQGWEGFVTEHQRGTQTLPLTNQASPSHPLYLGCFSHEVT